MPIGQNNVIEDPDMGITLSDGTRLSARVWMPDNASSVPVPAILEFLPYRKRDGTCARDELTHPYFASHGYACLRVDMRGNGDSQGVMDDEYSPRELADAVDVINWIAAQDWCSGSTGMMGISWGGFNALQVTALSPKLLKAIITICSTVDRFADDIHYKGGCLLNSNFGWGATMLSYSSRAPDPAIVGDSWREMWLQRLNDEPLLSARWASHQHRDAYWKHGSVCENYGAINAATLAIGGWADGYRNAPQALVENLNAPVKAIVGPWIHKYPHIASPEPRIHFLKEALRWWDKWLKNIETGVQDDADLRLYLIQGHGGANDPGATNGRWIDQNFRAAPQRKFHLCATGLRETPNAFELPIDSPADTGMAADEYFTTWPPDGPPADQRRDDALSTCFDSNIMLDDLAIVGAPVVSLTLSCDAPVAQIAVRLNDVHPDGRVNLITYGVLNLSHRCDTEQPAPMVPNTQVTVNLKLDQTAYELGTGHRLRLSISNAYWPLLWPAPGRTSLTLTAGEICLPLLHETAENNVQFDSPHSAPPWQTRTIRKASNTRETSFDQMTGITTLHVLDDAGEVEDLNHGLINGSIAREWWHIHPNDPLSARRRAHWSDHLARDSWSVRTETFSEMWSDETAFHFSGRVEAYEGDDLIFEKDFSKSVPRNLV